MVEHMADAQFEYTEDQDYLDIQTIQETKTSSQPKSKPANIGSGGGKKMKKIIIEKTPNPEQEEEKEYPHLIQPRPQTAASTQNNSAAWNMITSEKIKKGEEHKEMKKERVTPYIDKQ